MSVVEAVSPRYAFSRGLFFSHIGWLFFKPVYSKLDSVEKNDLERDPVVEFQSTYFYPLAICVSFMVPTLIGHLWGDAIGAFVWGGLVHKVIAWNGSFLVNSFAHWQGPQNYSDEMLAKGNTLLAVITLGEGNHNFHAFSFDFRTSPGKFEFDPSKWLILFLAEIGFIAKLKRADDEDIKYAMEYMQKKHKAQRYDGKLPLHEGQLDVVPWEGPIFSRKGAEEYIRAFPPATRRFVVIHDYLVDVTKFMKDHPGGAAIFRPYSVQVRPGLSRAHSRHTMNARTQLRKLAVAKILEKEEQTKETYVNIRKVG